jgi:hypothetical protein
MGYEPIQIRKSVRDTAPHWVAPFCSILVSTLDNPLAPNPEERP